MESPDSNLPRVLQFRSSIGFFGAENVIYNLVHTYAGAMLTVCLADARDTHTELCDRLKEDGLEATTIPAKGAFDFGTIRRLIRVARAFQPDILHFHEYKTTLIGWPVARWLRIPAVATLHGFVGGTAAVRRYERLEALIIPRLDRVIAVSGNTAERAQQMGVRKERLTLIPNGINLQQFQPSERQAEARRGLGLPEAGYLVALVGRLSEEKGHILLITAIARLVDDGIDAHAVFAGDGPLRDSLVERAVSAGIANRIHMPGSVVDASRVYHAADVVALPSYKEGMPLTILEAGACGRPVVATGVGDISKTVVAGKTGLIVPTGDADSLAQALALLARKPGDRDSMGRAARKRIEKRYSVQMMTDAYTAVYREVSRAPTT